MVCGDARFVKQTVDVRVAQMREVLQKVTVFPRVPLTHGIAEGTCKTPIFLD